MITDLFEQAEARLERLPMEDADVSFSPNFLDKDRAQQFFERLISETDWKAVEISVWGKTVLQPRLICWHGDEDASYKYSGVRLKPLPWTPLLSDIRHLVESQVSAQFNSVLLNLYRDQNDSMGWHSDDEKELGANPVIASLTLGETRTFIFRHKAKKELKKIRLPLNSGSLLVMSGDTQKNWAHSIPKESASLGKRINLTFRFVQR